MSTRNLGLPFQNIPNPNIEVTTTGLEHNVKKDNNSKGSTETNTKSGNATPNNSPSTNAPGSKGDKSNKERTSKDKEVTESKEKKEKEKSCSEEHVNIIKACNTETNAKYIKDIHNWIKEGGKKFGKKQQLPNKILITLFEKHNDIKKNCAKFDKIKHTLDKKPKNQSKLDDIINKNAKLKQEYDNAESQLKNQVSLDQTIKYEIIKYCIQNKTITKPIVCEAGIFKWIILLMAYGKSLNETAKCLGAAANAPTNATHTNAAHAPTDATAHTHASTNATHTKGGLYINKDVKLVSKYAIAGNPLDKHTAHHNNKNSGGILSLNEIFGTYIKAEYTDKIPKLQKDEIKQQCEDLKTGGSSSHKLCITVNLNWKQKWLLYHNAKIDSKIYKAILSDIKIICKCGDEKKNTAKPSDKHSTPPAKSSGSTECKLHPLVLTPEQIIYVILIDKYDKYKSTLGGSESTPAGPTHTVPTSSVNEFNPEIFKIYLAKSLFEIIKNEPKALFKYANNTHSIPSKNNDKKTTKLSEAFDKCTPIQNKKDCNKLFSGCQWNDDHNFCILKQINKNINKDKKLKEKDEKIATEKAQKEKNKIEASANKNKPCENRTLDECPISSLLGIKCKISNNKCVTKQQFKEDLKAAKQFKL
jgi:hypothetical protein